MEAVSLSDGKGRHHMPTSSVHHHQPGATLGNPLQGVEHRVATLQKRLQIKQIRAQIEDCIPLTNRKVMNRTRIFQRHSLPISQTVHIEAIEVKPRHLSRKEDSEVEHFSCVCIELWMSREWTGIVKTPVELNLAQGFQGLRIHCPGQSLLAECQQPVLKVVDAHIRGGLQAIVDSV